MIAVLRTFGILLVAVLSLFVFVQLVVRIVRYFYKFPIPNFLIRFIDNPLRRKIQQPDRLVQALGATGGMRVLEVGPGSGAYTQFFSAALGSAGFIAAVDIEPAVLRALSSHLAEFSIENVYPLVADVHRPPFAEGVFDAVYMIAVIGEIPQANEAFQSFYRLLKPSGRLMFSELLLDPDFTLPRTLRSWAEAAGFKFVEKVGNLLAYSISFQRFP